MTVRRRRHPRFLLPALLVVVIGSAVATTVVLPAGAVPQPDPIPLVAAGDMALCGSGGAAQVAALMDTLPGTILGLGDYAYPNGTAAEFTNCFDPHFGRHRSRMIPTVGNHEYNTAGAVPYSNYFGAAAGDPSKFYFDLQLGNWHLIVLNSNCGEVGGCGVGSEQYRWLQTELAASPAESCRIVTMHHPRWSSYSSYTNATDLGPMFSLLYEAGTDLVLTGHSHHYERFARQTPTQAVDLERGFALITAGAGGYPLRTSDIVAPNSLVRRVQHGALALQLRQDSYDLQFVGANGAGVVDQASASCVNTPDLAVTPAQAPLYRLYHAVFLRDPDPAGLQYWTDVMAGGVSLARIGGFFAESQEFGNRYAQPDDASFVDLLYQNTLGRDPEPAGRAYWLDLMARGTPRGAIVIAFSDAPEFAAKHPLP